MGGSALTERLEVPLRGAPSCHAKAPLATVRRPSGGGSEEGPSEALCRGSTIAHVAPSLPALQQ
eukprot:5021054-Alexandrium_andersonii.AAC.1